jgi:hypothetical protein
MVWDNRNIRVRVDLKNRTQKSADFNISYRLSTSIRLQTFYLVVDEVVAKEQLW